MPKNAKRLTRAEKVALSKLTENFLCAGAIGAREADLDSLAARGFAAGVLEMGTMRYAIAEKGREYRVNTVSLVAAIGPGR